MLLINGNLASVTPEDTETLLEKRRLSDEIQKKAKKINWYICHIPNDVQHDSTRHAAQAVFNNSKSISVNSSLRYLRNMNKCFNQSIRILKDYFVENNLSSSKKVEAKKTHQVSFERGKLPLIPNDILQIIDRVSGQGTPKPIQDQKQRTTVSNKRQSRVTSKFVTSPIVPTLKLNLLLPPIAR